MIETLATFLGDFGVTATFGSVTAQVLFDVNDTDAMLSGRMISAGYQIRYRSTDLVGLMHNSQVVINGTTYTVNEVMRLTDGAFTRATLEAQ